MIYYDFRQDRFGRYMDLGGSKDVFGNCEVKGIFIDIYQKHQDFLCRRKDK